MRQPGRNRSQVSALRATSRASEARSAGDTARRRERSDVRRDLRTSPKLESGSVTRRCRCEPLLSNQSNKWDELQQVRLSARSGLAQFCPQVLMSRGVSIRVRGNPARLSNTAGDAGMTLHYSCAARRILPGSRGSANPESVAVKRKKWAARRVSRGGRAARRIPLTRFARQARTANCVTARAAGLSRARLRPARATLAVGCRPPPRASRPDS